MSARRLVSALVACTVAGSLGAALTAPGADAAAAGGAKQLHPEIRTVNPRVVSPTPDDANVAITFRLDVESNASLEVVDADTEAVVWGPTPVTAAGGGPLDAGGHTFNWDVRDNGGDAPPDGRYNVVLDTTDAAMTDAGSDSAGLVIDSVGPAVRSVEADVRTLYPVKDGYADTTTISIRGIGPSAKGGGVVEVSNAAHAVVRTLRFDLTYTAVTWNGRLDNGAVAPPGRYTYRALVHDEAGNVGTSPRGSISVSGKRVVEKTFTKTVSARSSLRENRSGRCGDLYGPSRHHWKGSIGYYGWAHCRAAGRAGAAVGLHSIKVPKAVRYLSVKVGAYGGAAFGRAPSYAALTLLEAAHKYRPSQTEGSLPPEVRYHRGIRQRADEIVDPADRLLAWTVSSRVGGFYDVKNFTVTLVYKALA